MKKRTAVKDEKVYHVDTALIERNSENKLEDMPSYSRYTVVAHDVEEAIAKAKPRFLKDEYVEEVSKVTTLDWTGTLTAIISKLEELMKENK